MRGGLGVPSRTDKDWPLARIPQGCGIRGKLSLLGEEGDTEYRDYGKQDRAYGYAESRAPEPIYDSPPFNPQMEYDNRVSNVRNLRQFPSEYGARDQGRENPRDTGRGDRPRF